MKSDNVPLGFESIGKRLESMTTDDRRPPAAPAENANADSNKEQSASSASSVVTYRKESTQNADGVSGPTGQTDTSMLSFIKNAWHGKIQLWKIYWAVGLPLVIFDRLSEKIMPAELLLVLLLPFLAIYVWWLVSVWKCAPNTSHGIWTVLARAAVVIGALMTVGEILKVFKS